MSRLPPTGLRAARPAVTSWFLLALTALAALLASGLEPGRVPDASTRLLAAAQADSQRGETDRRADAQVPSVGAVLGAAPAPAGPPPDLATGGDGTLLRTSSGPAPLPDDAADWADAAVVRRSGRAPPVTTGT